MNLKGDKIDAYHIYNQTEGVYFFPFRQFSIQHKLIYHYILITWGANYKILLKVGCVFLEKFAYLGMFDFETMYTW